MYYIIQHISYKTRTPWNATIEQSVHQYSNVYKIVNTPISGAINVVGIYN